MTSIDVCIKCGAKKGSKPFRDMLCLDCYKPKFQIPSTLAYEYCGRCGSIKQGRDWKKIALDDLGKKYGLKVKGPDVAEAFVDLENSRITVYLETDQGRYPIDYPIRIDKMKSICDDCRKLSGGYYEAIIQLRGRPERIRKWKKQLTEILAKDTFIAGIIELKEGVDIRVGDSRKALSLVRNLKLCEYIVTRKLWGMKEGKRVYRTTIALRFD